MASAGTTYTSTFKTATSADEVTQTFIGGLSGAAGCTVTMAGNNVIVVTRRYTPTWAVVVGVVGILLFLIGLLAFLYKVTDTLTITVAPGDEGTKVTISGVASPELSSRLNGIAASLNG